MSLCTRCSLKHSTAERNCFTLRSQTDKSFHPEMSEVDVITPKAIESGDLSCATSVCNGHLRSPALRAGGTAYQPAGVENDRIRIRISSSTASLAWSVDPPRTSYRLGANVALTFLPTIAAEGASRRLRAGRSVSATFLANRPETSSADLHRLLSCWRITSCSGYPRWSI